MGWVGGSPPRGSDLVTTTACVFARMLRGLSDRGDGAEYLRLGRGRAEEEPKGRACREGGRRRRRLHDRGRRIETEAEAEASAHLLLSHPVRSAVPPPQLCQCAAQRPLRSPGAR